MLAKEGDKIDSINATVPDHMHAAICFTAMQAGKHVYCQKPMCHDVAEIRALTELAARKQVKTQLGNQHSSAAGDRMAVAWLKDGVIGRIKHVYLCSNRASGMAYRLNQPDPPTAPVPAHLDWDLWLGRLPSGPMPQRSIIPPNGGHGWISAPAGVAISAAISSVRRGRDSG
jgi:hypothetical protein